MSDQCHCKDGKVVKPRKPPQKCTKSKSKPKTSSPDPNTSNSRPVLEFPHFLRVIGPKQVNVMMQFVPSAITYSITSLLLVVYMAEWKTVLQYLPYYNGKYEDESTEKKEDDEKED